MDVGGSTWKCPSTKPTTLSYGMSMLLCLWQSVFNKSTHVPMISSKNVRSDNRAL